MSRKFNPARMPEVVAVPTRKKTRRAVDKAVRKFAKFFNVDATFEDVIEFGGLFDYEFTTSGKFVLFIEANSGYDRIAMRSPEVLDLAIVNETDTAIVVVL